MERCVSAEERVRNIYGRSMFLFKRNVKEKKFVFNNIEVCVEV